jgi:hypothetical protein
LALYGPKPGPFGDFLRSCQDRVRESIRQLGTLASFRSYSLAQIHATLIGLERVDSSGRNRNFDAFRGAARVMRLPELFRFLIESDDFPFWIQFGGFEDRDYPFRSRGARPYDRSFSLQGALAVVMGWPVRPDRGEDARYPQTLDRLRRNAQRFNVLHRWHPEPADIDNDLYLRLGAIEGELRDTDRQSIEDAIRTALSAAPPLHVRLGVSDLCVVSYPEGDEALPEARTRVFRLTDPRLHDDEGVARLYA